MTTKAMFDAGPYRLVEDYYYATDTHLWVAIETDGGTARCGFDPLGAETSGDIVAVSFESVGDQIARGEAFGNMEAAKFVGPLIAPVSGTLVACNDAVIGNPSLLNQDPIENWLVELELTDMEADLALLLHGKDRVTAWIESEIERFKEQGMIAE